MSGIVKVNGYIFWYNVDVVEEKILDFLIDKFSSPKYLISKELNKADFFIQSKDVNIPVEIQSTIIGKRKGEIRKRKGEIRKRKDELRIGIHNSAFEERIQKQITQNIQNYGYCCFFMDSEYLLYLQNELTRKARINLDWFYQFIKEDKLKVFTIDYKRNITETSLNDFKFIGNISMTCEVGEDEDFRVLDRNKLKIMNKVLKGYNFTDNEILEFEEDFDEVNGKRYKEWLHRKDSSKREKLLGNILHSIGSLYFINQIFDVENYETKSICKSIYKRKNVSSVLNASSNLGLFKIKGNGSNSKICFIDIFNIAEFFPRYIKKKREWNFIKNKEFKSKEFWKFVYNKNTQFDKPNLTKFFKSNFEHSNFT